MKLVWFLSRVLIGGIFAYAGFLKVTAPVQDFHAQILEYGLFSYQPALVAAYILPWVEIFCGIFLILGFMIKLSALGCSFLALSFLGMMGLSYLKMGQLPESCGCFGEGLKLPIYVTIILDFALLFLGAKLAFLKQHLFSIDSKVA